MTDSAYEQASEQIEKTNKVKVKKNKHNYTSELELKSLLIRIKNMKADQGSLELNSRINKYIKWHTAIVNKKYDAPAKRNEVKNNLKERIVRYSELTRADEKSYERFGAIILLMVKNILRKPQFCGYTYRDDFYSDAVYKILKYLHNFDHTLKSQRTGQPVNAFAYVSQIIHNSIIFILNQKKKETDKIKHQIAINNLDHNLQLKYVELVKHDVSVDLSESSTKTINLVPGEDIVSKVIMVQNIIDQYDRIEIIYPIDYEITFDMYNELKEHLNGKISIMRATDEV